MKKDNPLKSQLASLKTVGDVGASNASKALAQMIDKEVKVNVSKVSMVDVERMPEEIGVGEKMIVGIYEQLFGDANGNGLLTFDEESALLLADTMLGSEGNASKLLTEDRVSALKELGNILIGAYLTAVGNTLGINILTSVPYIASDMAGAVLDLMLIDMGRKVEQAIVINTEFTLPSIVLNGSFLMFFEPESYEKIIKTLNSYSGEFK